ncbi:hypothetical protein SARC_13891 [Sphaeroforma arctica JP610]|uniref:Uncharacterized protein n=1 Tax=Sphaeroforma arctica JP610 TaxID=667725 RepID=A0A0L0FA08_9EUKA|nr:hypothetical protein SARC_13891 [Sphaeroforma arctica JP610]KNC73550.1 hypothetical protein SARC_13891 [Sphaeroforma arctica JP610]|eukprot:XP_014147452.1 hypothetical protein SARC_13891 [Sphaeroforma arctica JP610]
MPLRKEFGVAEQETYFFLDMINNHIIQPFLTVSSFKGQRKRYPRAMPFTDPEDICQRYAEDRSRWLQEDWYSELINSIPIQQQADYIYIDDDEDDNEN